MLEFDEADGPQAAEKQAELGEDHADGASRRVCEGDPEVKVTINKM